MRPNRSNARNNAANNANENKNYNVNGNANDNIKGNANDNANDNVNSNANNNVNINANVNMDGDVSKNIYVYVSVSGICNATVTAAIIRHQTKRRRDTNQSGDETPIKTVRKATAASVTGMGHQTKWGWGCGHQS